ncbi:ATP-binding protein [Nocardioides sp. NPDC087217]|uniref:ATP-binding protein n=1 Tax=Nocardioides sp. NPDC087217 TaxID=3364335 RepID=UPI0038010BA1
MTKDPQPSRFKKVSPAAKRILALGESDRYEFKRDIDAVTPKLLAGLANWVSLDPDRDAAHLLVGVDEAEDTDTGLVYGVPCGLAKGLDKSVARIQDMASKVRPIPVDVRIIEEVVEEPTPFIRIEIRPTMAPHFDDEGRRQTRQGRSTRALTDDELLGIYLDREAGSFATRFRQTTTELQSAVGAVGGQVDQIADAIETNIAEPIARMTATAADAADAPHSAASSADSAAAAADSASYELEDVQRLVKDLHEVVEQIQEEEPQSLASRVIGTRRKIWWEFTVDTFEHTSVRATRLAEQLRDLLQGEVAIDAAHNTWELGLWEELLNERKNQNRGRGTQAWWSGVVKEVPKLMERPQYGPPNLPDLRAAIKADIDHEVDDPGSVTNQFRALIDNE